MTALTKTGKLPVLIHGVGRSGTSWVSKIFDHHPMVFSSHEPERFVARPDPSDAGAIRGYAETLFATRPLRAMRKRPILAKPYRSRLAHETRRGLLYMLTGMERFTGGNSPWLRGLQVPDFADLSGVTLAVKSVSHQMLLPALARHVPELKIVFLIRHPCGNIRSNMTGQRIGKMAELHLPPRAEMARLFSFDRPAEDLTEADFDQIEILAYRWAVFNDIAWRGLNGLQNARVLRYEDLCADPVGQARELLEWTGLDWHDDCARFLQASLDATETPSGYHALQRNPAVAAHKWREEMDPAEVKRVIAICRRSSAFALFEEA
ncbi:MAG: sulfotransferase [Pseudomonadota bacterium]